MMIMMIMEIRMGLAAVELDCGSPLQSVQGACLMY